MQNMQNKTHRFSARDCARRLRDASVVSQMPSIQTRCFWCMSNGFCRDASAGGEMLERPTTKSMNIIIYKSGYKYQLNNDYYQNSIGINPDKDIDIYYLKLSTNGDLFIRSGYAWDGPSGPAFDTKNFMRASLVHDALYQIMREGYLPQHYRDKADRLMQQICLEDGMSKARSWWVYRGVKWFAKSASDVANRKRLIYAPSKPNETA